MRAVCTLNSDMQEGAVIRWVWEAEVLSRTAEQTGDASSFGWADEFLAGYGLFLRDAKEKTFARMLDVMASRDEPAKQPILGTGEPVGRARCARWRTGGPVANILREIWTNAGETDRERPETWETAAEAIKNLKTGRHQVTPKRLAAAAKHLAVAPTGSENT